MGLVLTIDQSAIVTAATGDLLQSPPARNARPGTSFTATRTDWRQKAGNRLVELIRLPIGWDGFDGKPTKAAIAEYVWNLLELLLQRPGVPLPAMTPLSCGGLILEWHRKGWDIEIEIDAPASHHIYAHDLSTGAEDHFHLGARLDRLAGLIGKIAD